MECRDTVIEVWKRTVWTYMGFAVTEYFPTRACLDTLRRWITTPECPLTQFSFSYNWGILIFYFLSIFAGLMDFAPRFAGMIWIVDMIRGLTSGQTRPKLLFKGWSTFFSFVVAWMQTLQEGEEPFGLNWNPHWRQESRKNKRSLLP